VQSISLSTLCRLIGLGLQFGLLLLVYWRMPTLINLYIESLFLSGIGLSVTKAGANFATLRARAPLERYTRESFRLVLPIVRVLLGASAISLAALSRTTPEVPYAAFLGLLLGLVHNHVYKRFLSGSYVGNLAFAFFGFAHFGSVLSFLLLSAASFKNIQGEAVVALGVACIAAFTYVLRANVALALGELAYSYAYPFLIYVVSIGFSGTALWFYFVAAKIVDAISILVSFVFQPRFYRKSREEQGRAARRAKRLFDRGFFLMLPGIAAVVAADWHSGLRDVEGLIPVSYGLTLAFAFLLSSIGAYIFVSIVDSNWKILAYGVALSVLPVSLFFWIEDSGYRAIGYVAALLAIWSINQVSGWHRMLADAVSQRNAER
jgi:hypothetical protein